MHYIYLMTAILGEVIGTSFLKQSEGFTKLVPTTITLTGYFVAFYFLSLSLRVIPTGIAYAIWSGIGVVLIVAAARIFHDQKLDLPALIGISFIITGVIIMQVFSKSISH